MAVADSLSLREFLGFALDESTPDHSTHVADAAAVWVETHKAVFRWVVKILGERRIDARADDRHRRDHAGSQRRDEIIVRRDNGRSYDEYLKGSGAGGGDRESHARAGGAAGPEAQKEGLQ